MKILKSRFGLKELDLHLNYQIQNHDKYSRLSLTQLYITQYYHLSRPDGPVPVFSPIYYCNSTTFISTTAKSIKTDNSLQKNGPADHFSVFYNA